MATSLTASLAVNLTAQFSNPLDVGAASYPVQYSPNYVLTDGTGANQAKSVFVDTRTLTASSSEDLDLSGVLLDAFGNALSFTKIKALIIQADAANVNDVVVGGATSNGAFPFFGASTERVKVKPGGVVAFIAPDVNGYAITAGTADLLKVLNGGAGTSVIYTIAIVGV